MNNLNTSIVKRYPIPLFAIVLSSLMVGFGVIQANWSAPTQNPPGGNVSAPVNTSSTTQTKIGNFISQGEIIAEILSANVQVQSDRYCNRAGTSCINFSDLESLLSGSDTPDDPQSPSPSPQPRLVTCSIKVNGAKTITDPISAQSEQASYNLNVTINNLPQNTTIYVATIVAHNSVDLGFSGVVSQLTAGQWRIVVGYYTQQQWENYSQQIESNSQVRMLLLNNHSTRVRSLWGGPRVLRVSQTSNPPTKASISSRLNSCQ